MTFTYLFIVLRYSIYFVQISNVEITLIRVLLHANVFVRYGGHFYLLVAVRMSHSVYLSCANSSSWLSRQNTP